MNGKSADIFARDLDFHFLSVTYTYRRPYAMPQPSF